MAKQKILVVDDEEPLCEILQFNLEREGYEVDVAYSGEEALERPLATYDLLLLDVMMGGMSGFQLAKRLRENADTAQLPIIFCTARDTENDLLTGFEIGGDDYISKPFSLREVVARVRTVLRRTARPEEKPKTMALGGLVVDLATKRCTVDGAEVPLTRKELEILLLFLANPNRIFSRAEILERVWSDEVIVLDRTIDVNITRLRKKIGAYGKHIVTRLGYGYGLET